MSTVSALARVSSSNSKFATRSLTVAATTWWAATLVGLWMFLFYIAGFYGRAIVTGNVQDWNRNHDLFKGYVPGDTAWNLYLGAHVLLAAVIAFGGVLQMVPQIRRHAIGFHRWNGRAFMLTAFGGGITGLWMTWVRGVGVSGDGKLGLVALSLDAGLILAFTLLAWVRVRQGDIGAHRRWALRLFMVANGVWFLRLGLFGWYLLTGGVGVTDNLDGPVNLIIDFACYLLPLALLELYLRTKDNGAPFGKMAVAAALLASTAYMCAGIFALTMYELPLVLRS
jgi:hypothetical protein